MKQGPEKERARLSVCIITRNEESNLGACLSSVLFADEVVIVDSLSTDATRRVATELCGAKLRWIDQEFLGHVKQKQLAVDNASNDLVLCVDADERVDEQLRGEIESALARGGATVGYEVNRHTFYLGRFIDHGGWFPEWRLRLFDRRRGRWTGVDPHDRVEVDGPVVRLAGELVHHNYRDIAHHVAKIDSYTTIIAREKDVAGRRARILDLLFRPPARFLRMYVVRGGFLDGARGLIVATLGAYYVFLKYAKLWERKNVSPRGPERAPERRGGA